MADTERLSPGARRGLIHQLKQGIAAPDEAREFLTEFVACVAAGEPVPPETLRCLQELFARYLNGKHNTLDKAFHVARKNRGRPRADPERETSIALAILAARVGNPGLSHLDALEEISEQWGCGTTKAGEAWARRRREAFDEFLLLRPLFSEAALTAEEVQRARKIASV